MLIITDRQRQVYTAILEHYRDTGHSPTIRDIMERTNIKSTNVVVCHLKPLVGKRLITYDGRKSRGIGVPAIDEAVRKVASGIITTHEGKK